jgi:HEAT repeat protein
MITYFCPNCWGEVPEGAAVCPHCRADLSKTQALSIEEKYILALHHPIAENRLIAAEMLGALGSRKALPEFERLLDEEQDYYILREVVLALTRISDPHARELLVAAANHPIPLVSRLARWHLAEASRK